MNLSIIIINYRSEKYLSKCLNSIPKSKDQEIIIFDNDGTLKPIKGIKTIPYTGNLGFAKGNNIAIQRAKGKYILTLNADCFLTKDYIKECIDFLEKNKEYSSVQGKLLNENNRKIIDSTGNILLDSGFAHSENHKKPNKMIPSHEIFGVCAAAALYRKEALEKVKINNEYFDNDFFAYLEDVDLDWRLRLAGYKAYFTSKAIAYHVREATTNPKYRTQQSLRNRLFMVLKNDSTAKMIFNLVFYTPILLLLPNRIKNLRLIPKMLKKRKIIQKNKKTANIPMEHTPLRKWVRIFNLLKQKGIKSN